MSKAKGSSNWRTAASGMSQEEGDRICRMVRDLVFELAQLDGVRPDPVRGVEPTGITVSPDMRPYVELRDVNRNRKKAS